jgi:hypothetical protein
MNEDLPLDAAVPEVVTTTGAEPEDVATKAENVAAAVQASVVAEAPSTTGTAEAPPTPAPTPTEETQETSEVDADLAMAVNEAAQEIVETEPAAVKEVVKKETKKRVRRVGKTTPNKMLKVVGDEGAPGFMTAVPLPTTTTTMPMMAGAGGLAGVNNAPLGMEQPALVPPAGVGALNIMHRVVHPQASAAFVPRVLSKHDEKWNR